jgi:hypothetical protein
MTSWYEFVTRRILFYFILFYFIQPRREELGAAGFDRTVNQGESVV